MEINGWCDIGLTFDKERAMLFTSFNEAGDVMDAWEAKNKSHACELNRVEWRGWDYGRISVYDLETDSFVGWLGGER